MGVYSTGGVHIDKAISGKKAAPMPLPGAKKTIKKTTKKATKKGK